MSSVTINVPRPGSGADKNYLHSQLAPATTWIVNHNLEKYPSVTVMDSAGTEMHGDVTHVSMNQCILEFSAAFGGTATLN